MNSCASTGYAQRAAAFFVKGLNKRYLALEQVSPHQFVYVIQAGDDGPVKIGYARKPSWRLAQLQCGSWMELHLRAVIPVSECIYIEQAAHVVAHSAHIRGEWFDLSPLEAVALVLEMAQVGGYQAEPLEDTVIRDRREIPAKAPQVCRDPKDEWNEARRAEKRRRLGID